MGGYIVGRKRKVNTDPLQLDGIEIVYKPEFEKEWVEVVASMVYRSIKHQLEEDGD